MKVFISWSGSRSKEVARALHDWIPCVIQAVKPWMSEQIAKGARWSPEIARELEETSFGIVCLTPENRTAPWLLFETGALSKTVLSARVCPFLLGLRPTDLDGPLAQFQAAKAVAPDTLELLESINNAQGEGALSPGSIKAAFDVWWPKLETKLTEIEQESASIEKPKKRSEMELLEEILDIVRQLRRTTSRQEMPASIARALARVRNSSSDTLAPTLQDYLDTIDDKDTPSQILRAVRTKLTDERNILIDERRLAIDPQHRASIDDAIAVLNAKIADLAAPRETVGQEGKKD